MSLYRYEAVDRSGKVVRGVMDASDEQEVVRNLLARGYSARAILGAPGSAASGASQSTGSRGGSIGSGALRQAASVPVSIRPRVPVHRLASFYRQLASLVRSGMTLSQSFGSLAAGCRDHRLRKAVAVIQQDLMTGQSLSGAMARYPDLFPAHTVGSIWCGEMGGTLDKSLDEVATDLEREANEERLGRIGWAVTKISVFVLVLMFPLFDLKRVVEPLAAEMASAAAGAEGYGAQILRSAITDVARHSLLPALTLLVFWLIWGHAKRIPGIRMVLDELLIKVPVWGRIHTFRSLCTFVRSLQTLYTAGVRPDAAWNAASTTPRNSAVARRLRNAGSAVGAFRGVGELAASAGLLDPEEVALINSGEKSGTLPESLARVATVYQQRVESLASVGRMWSFSLFVSAQIAIVGVGLVAMASSYVQALRLMGL